MRLLLDQQSEAQFQWTSYEDPAIRAIIPDEYFQNPNAWHVKVALVNYATELIIILELAYVSKYMPWFRIYGKPYLLSVEERQQQLRVQRERRGPLNLKKKDNNAS
ncbi:hypothetical protein Goshw_007943 [Gossypium schwendimanii]|uniref:Uncharacterized protein n=2 Tax=Gossypium schwendimanii TaxID=34291 RepID=A0A7J9N6J7_GOSSC|nr:hypothetical protein [Gossypium schwendimanii]